MEIKITIKPTSFILIFFKFWTKLIQKQTAVTSNIVPVELDFSLAKDTAIVGLQIVWFSIKIELGFSKNEDISTQDRTSTIRFLD